MNTPPAAYVSLFLADQEEICRLVDHGKAGNVFLVWTRLNGKAMREGNAVITAPYGELVMETGLARATIAGALRELERLAFIAAHRTGGTGTKELRQETIYRLLRGKYCRGSESELRGSDQCASALNHLFITRQEEHPPLPPLLSS